ncbi:hypothetical protein AB0L26_27935 [Streptomyces nondiastaticus]|uniref:hypothetical protein n=1 Tax=Streptomyces nondiastaticus TaxID=3154512 RepID=UPI00343AC840
MTDPYPALHTTPPGIRPSAYTPLAVPMPMHELPPGVDVVTLPDGTRTLAYTTPTTPAAPPPAAAAPGTVPVWAKTTALLAPTVGGGIAITGVGLSAAAPGLIAMTSALWAAVALIATSATAAVVLLSAARRRTSDNPGRTDPEPHITQNITATGMFGRATGTINHR